MRVRVPGQKPVANWLAELQDQQVVRRQFEHCSLVQIQGWSQVPPGSPLFHSLLVFENYPVDKELRGLQYGELCVRSVEAREQTNYPLTLTVTPDEQLHVRLQYDRTCFDSDTIQRIASHLETLLKGIVANSERCLRDLPLMTAAERQQILVEWNNTEHDYPREKCVHELFEEQVERTLWVYGKAQGCSDSATGGG